MKTRRIASLLSALLLVSTAAIAATYPELSEQRSARRAQVVGGLGNGYGRAGAMPYGANGTAYPAYGNTAMYMLPTGNNGLPDARQHRCG